MSIALDEKRTQSFGRPAELDERVVMVVCPDLLGENPISAESMNALNCQPQTEHQVAVVASYLAQIRGSSMREINRIRQWENSIERSLGGFKEHQSECSTDQSITEAIRASSKVTQGLSIASRRNQELTKVH